MAGPLKAEVVVARCPKNKKTYGVRVEQRERDWVRTWAFPIDEEKAKHEGFDSNTISGSMNATEEYPGCPYCKTKGFVLCGKCKKMGCDSGIVEGIYTCPWCGNSGTVYGAEKFDVSGGGY